MLEWLLAIFTLGCGVVALLAAGLNWEWFFQIWRVRDLDKAFGRTANRIIYFILGAMTAAGGAAYLLSLSGGG